jgi:hypothetical protein
MQVLLDELQSRLAFEMADGQRGLVSVRRNHDVDVIGKNRTGKDLITRLLHGDGESLADGSGLNTSEDHRWIA